MRWHGMCNMRRNQYVVCLSRAVLHARGVAAGWDGMGWDE